jgi:drug/metabolite transporter (DMT)-like permease
MLNFVLYATAALIWGSTWLGIKLQLTQVPPVLSVGYRFCLAPVILFLYCTITKKRLVFSQRDHFFMAAQGFSLFGLGYIMSYLATSYLTSGLVAVIFSTILMWNILNLRLFMRQPVAWRAFSGGVLGLAGICIVFWHDLSAFAATRGLIGLIIALLGAYCASIGNVVGSRNAKSGVPVTQANVYGMAYGALLCIVIHFGVGGDLTMDWTLGYLGPLLYLTVFGSVVAFGCYMLLIGRIGADYAAYVMLLMPVVALLLSTFFESYRWSASAVVGVSIVLFGNLLILTPAATLERIYRLIKKYTAST